MEIGSYADCLSALANVGVAAAAICAAILAHRSLNDWMLETIGKRRAELAEQMLADFYKARDVCRDARQPLAFGNEGSTRGKEDGETEQDTQKLNSYFTVTERLKKENEFFANLHARQYRFFALFGHDSQQIWPFDELFRIRTEIIYAASQLMYHYMQVKQGENPPDLTLREKWRTAIGLGDPKNDEIPGKLDEIVVAVEKICRRVIDELEAKREAYSNR